MCNLGIQPTFTLLVNLKLSHHLIFLCYQTFFPYQGVYFVNPIMLVFIISFNEKEDKVDQELTPILVLEMFVGC